MIYDVILIQNYVVSFKKLRAHGMIELDKIKI